MESGLVSIITPSYNTSAFIEETIRSVQQQTYPHWEMIIVDDASTDNSVALIRSIAETDSRIKLHQLPGNSGPGYARDLAVKNAQGDYIAFIDADDLWHPQKLQKQLNHMQTNNLPFTFCFYDCVDEDGKPLGRVVTAPKKLTYRMLFFCNFIGNLTGIYSTAYFGKLSIRGIRKRQDWIMWLSILKEIRTGSPVPEVLASYRIRKGSVSSSKFGLLKYNYAVYRQYHRQHVLTALLSMAVFIVVQLGIKPLYIRKS